MLQELVIKAKEKNGQSGKRENVSSLSWEKKELALN